jgi:hypothetical protein
MAREREKLEGLRFERLTVIAYVGKTKQRVSLYRTRCDCGNETVVESYALKAGLIKSCGCYHRDDLARRSTIHGASAKGVTSPEYYSWRSMKLRCYYKSGKDYHQYGGRGIKVCLRWRKSFSNFLEDMGKRPSADHTLDRINSNGNYTLKNCKWSTRKEQSNNRRDNILGKYRYKRKKHSK